MKLHPLCTLFPRLAGEDYESLKNDIAAHGLRQPITVHDGMILDGGNRYRACCELGISPTLAEFTGENPVTYVLSMNLHRRHMERGQYAAIVACAQDWAKAQPAYRPEKGAHGEHLNDTTKARAEKAGVSVSTQRRADAVAKVDPDLAKKVAQGNVSLSEAVREVAPQLDRRAKREKGVPESQAPDGNDDDLAEAHETIRVLAEENEALRDRVAVGAMDGNAEEKHAVADTLAELRQQVKTLEAELSAVKTSRDKYQRENAELKRQCQMQRKEIDKLKATPAA